MTHDIGLATRADLSDIAAIAGETDLFPPEMTPDMAEPAMSGTAPDLWLVARVPGPTGDRAAAEGFAFAAPERMTEGTWNLLALAVRPARQGQGLGRALVGATEAAVRARGARLLLVETLGTAGFAATRAFYLALGFGAEALIRDYYMPGGDKVVFRKAL